MIDMTKRQDIHAMRMLPDEEHLEAARAMKAALSGTKGREIKAIDVDGALRILVRVGDWWYYPNAERGWRAPEMRHPNHTTTERTCKS